MARFAEAVLVGPVEVAAAAVNVSEVVEPFVGT